MSKAIPLDGRLIADAPHLTRPFDIVLTILDITDIGFMPDSAPYPVRGNDAGDGARTVPGMVLAGQVRGTCICAVPDPHRRYCEVAPARR